MNNDNKKYNGDKHRHMKMCKSIWNRCDKVSLLNTGQVDNRLSRAMNAPSPMTDSECADAIALGKDVRGGYVV